MVDSACVQRSDWLPLSSTGVHWSEQIADSWDGGGRGEEFGAHGKEEGALRGWIKQKGKNRRKDPRLGSGRGRKGHEKGRVGSENIAGRLGFGVKTLPVGDLI